MRKDAENWWKQALEDFDTARVNFENKKYYAAVFFCQQAIEKGLKSLFIIKKKKPPGVTHSLIYLAKEVGVPKKFFSPLKKITPEFVTTRYPDVVGEVPAKLYDEVIAKEFLKESKKVIRWLKNQISKL